MIDYGKSAELNGMEMEELKVYFERFPKSGKRIIRICDSCKENRELCFCDYRPLCRKCSHNTPKSLKAHSDATTKYFTNQCARDRLSEIMKLFHKEHPEWGNSHSEWMIEYCKDPEVRKLMSIRTIERLSDQLVRDKISKSMVQYYIDNPEKRNKVAKRVIQWHKDHPESGKAYSETMIQYYIDNPEKRSVISKIIMNSEAAKENWENMCGGNDIVKHHFIYDHNNPDQHTVEITRSQHTAHHHWMRRNGLEVPRLNVTEDNKYIFRRLKYNGT